MFFLLIAELLFRGLTIVDFTGSLTNRGPPYGLAITQASNWANETDGINGRLNDLDTVKQHAWSGEPFNNAYRFAVSYILYTMLIISLRYPKYLPEEATNSAHVSCSGTHLSHYSRKRSLP